MTKRCICEICTCGRHRCPHAPSNLIGKGGERPCQLTEYTTVYKPLQPVPRESFKPTQKPIESAPFDATTTQQRDYIKHPLEKPFVHQPDQYHKPEGDIENTTSYKQAYTEKYAPPAKAIRNEPRRMTAAKFEGEPTYRHDYKKWDPSRQQAYGMQAQWQPPTDRFDDQTTFKHDFIPYQHQPRQSFKPLEGAKMSETPFDDRTGYRDAYIQHALPPKFVREREAYKPTGAPLQDSTTFKSDYKGAPGSRMQSFKPDNQAFSSGAPLEDMTTNRHDYQKWAAQRPYVHLPETYQKPEGEMATETTHKTTYKEMPFVKVQAVRPVSANRAKDVPFDGRTNYAQDYKKWQADRVVIPKQADYVPNQAPFEGHSTYKGHYVPLPVAPARSFRPDNQAFQSDAKFEDGTMYRHDYTPKEIQICEAAYIDQGRSRYKFQELDSRGHRMYAPVMTTVSPLGGSRAPSQSQQRLAMSVA